MSVQARCVPCFNTVLHIGYPKACTQDQGIEQNEKSKRHYP